MWYGGRAPGSADEGSPEGAGVAQRAVDARPLARVVEAVDLREGGAVREQVVRGHGPAALARNSTHLEIQYQVDALTGVS